MGDAFEQFGTFRPGVPLKAAVRGSRLEVPVTTAIDRLAREDAILRKGIAEGGCGATLESIAGLAGRRTPNDGAAIFNRSLANKPQVHYRAARSIDILRTL